MFLCYIVICIYIYCVVGLKKLAQVQFKVSSHSNQLVLESNIHSLEEVSHSMAPVSGFPGDLYLGLAVADVEAS